MQKPADTTMTSNTEDENPTKTGQCLCGAIKYSLTGASAKPYYNTICHCLNCRRVTGSAFLLASITSRSGFIVTSGASSQKSYQDTSTSSGTALTRVSCGICSSNLFAFTPLWDEIVSIAAGTLDDFDEKWEPDTEQWCVHRVGWLGDKDWGVDGGRKFERAVKKE